MSGPAPSGSRDSYLFGAALARRAWKGKADTARRLDRKSHPQGRAGKDCCCVVEDVAQGLGGERAMRRAERRQRDLQLAIGDANVTCRGEQLMQQGSPLVIDAGIVRPQQCNELALGLIGNHLDDVGQVLAFRGELDHSLLAELSNFDALGDVAALLEQPR